ncbi:MAG: hypothetical protein KDA84_13195, partial [Planctomycetaceae bacterium]|nr:hypothetical protein [Planctomycetaceae bacterium]
MMLVIGLFGPSLKSAVAQDETGPPPPLVIINAAGVDRLLGDVNFMFKTIGREDLMGVVNGFLGNVGDLKGLDRKKSMGVMLYLKQGFPPGVDPVGFVPVDNIKDLLDTIQLGPVKTKKVPGEENRYEIEGPRQTLYVELQGGYAYVSNNVDAIDRELPDPGPLTQALTTRYDLAASVNVEGVPEGMRTILLDFLRAQTEAEMQQRDGEPEASYRARKAAGKNNLRIIEAIAKDGKTITLGVDASQESKSIVVELEMKAKPSSGFAKDLQRFPGKPTVFANVYNERVPMAMTGSWNLSKDDQDVFSELVKALDAGVTQGLQNQNLDPTPIQGIVKSLGSTVNNGSMDFFVQFVGEPPGKFVLLGALKVNFAADFATGLEGILKQVGQLPSTAEMEINAENHNGIALHRVLGKGDGDRGERNLYGGKPQLYIGAGRGAVWFALGKEDAAKQLKAAMTQVETPSIDAITPDKIAPFQMILNLSSWVALNGDGGDQAQPRFPEPRDEKDAERQARIRARFEAESKARQAAAKDAFNPDNDLLRVTTQ